MHLLVYVDDILISGSDLQLIEELKGVLKSHFHLKDLGHLRYFLGLEVVRDANGIMLNQRKYALELITESGLTYVGSVPGRMMQNLKLTTRDYDKRFDINLDERLVDDVEQYKHIVGRLLYLTMT